MKGFIALISVSLIVAFTLGVVAASSMRGYALRQALLHREMKEAEREALRACGESLKLVLVADPSFEGGVRVFDRMCTVSRRDGDIELTVGNTRGRIDGASDELGHVIEIPSIERDGRE